jgi:hypothetical protein
LFLCAPCMNCKRLTHNWEVVLCLHCTVFVGGAGVAQSVYCLTTVCTTGVRSPAGKKNFFSNLCVQTGSGAHPASCTMGTGGPFPGAKRGRGVTLTTHHHLVPRSRMSKICTSSPPNATMACSGTALLLLL